jgi:hypothetical protein
VLVYPGYKIMYPGRKQLKRFHGRLVVFIILSKKLKKEMQAPENQGLHLGIFRAVKSSSEENFYFTE